MGGVANYIPGERPAVLPRDESGRFITGAGYPQLWGAKTERTAEEFAASVWQYITACEAEGKPVTLAGCARMLAMDTGALLDWCAGGSHPVNSPGHALCVAAGSALRTAREAWLEANLTDKQFATGGVIFSLKNQFASRWRDDSYIHTTGAGAGGPSVAVTIQVAGMAQRVDVDVQRATGATVDAVSWAESMALEGDRIRSSVPALPAWDDEADEGDCPFD